MSSGAFFRNGKWHSERIGAAKPWPAFKAILAADPEIVEEWKWMGSPVWSRDGNLVVGNIQDRFRQS